MVCNQRIVNTTNSWTQLAPVCWDGWGVCVCVCVCVCVGGGGGGGGGGWGVCVCVGEGGGGVLYWRISVTYFHSVNLWNVYFAHSYILTWYIVINFRDQTVKQIQNHYFMMTSSNGNIFPVTGQLCEEFTGPRVTRYFGVFFHLRLNKRLCKQPWSLWFETPSPPLWRHHNVILRKKNCKDYFGVARVCVGMITSLSIPLFTGYFVSS